MARTLKEDKKNRAELDRLLSERILVVDGATGTGLELAEPTADDFGGEQFVGSNEMLNAYAPDIVLGLHEAYIEAGVDVIETNSFNGSPIVMAEYGIEERARELARKSAELANEAVTNLSFLRKQESLTDATVLGGDSCFRRNDSDVGRNDSDIGRNDSDIGRNDSDIGRNDSDVGRNDGDLHRVYVMGSMGPGTKSITVTGGITFDEVKDAYYIYASGLLEGGADILLLETMQDTLNLKAALQGIRQAQQDQNRDAPVCVSVTIEMGGTMLAGQNIEALYHTMSGYDLFSIGLNCATGPAMMTDHLRTLARLSRFPVTVWPNAGLPDVDGNYSEDADVFREVIGRFACEGFINMVGGCCGTTPDHIRAMKEVVDGVKPRKLVENGHYPSLAGAESVTVEADNRPIFVGERTNTIGSRKFKRLISTGKWDEAAEIGRKQVNKGAMVVDLCTANPDRDEVSDFVNVLRPMLRKVRVPVMMDTTDAEVVELGLKQIGGKPAINSVNLEDGGERLRQVVGLAKEFGASLVCGLIDDDPDQGMAVTVERKLEVADKIYRILKDEFNVPDGDIIFDPLVFPAGTGDPNYIGSAKATIQGVRAVKQKYPNCLTILGVSNVSFGLPPAGREVVNSLFLYLTSKAGLDFAIVNTQKLKRYPSIPDNEIALAEAVLMQGDSDSINELTAYFRDTKVTSSEDEWAGLTTEQKITQAVIEARREGLTDNIDELLSRMKPLEIINGPLMAGMDEVGKLFGDNRLIVAEVLESAEVMKKAVDQIKPHFPPGESMTTKGKMLLATVKGDVHDIGKNLVDMILSNNGFEIINLGIKVAPETIIEAVQEHQPDMIGLSGLLVRSAQQMVHTAADLSAAGIDIPLIVGGAALSKKFTRERIAPAYKGAVFYASDAMMGLTICNDVVNPEVDTSSSPVTAPDSHTIDTAQDRCQPRRVDSGDSVWIKTDVPTPPDLERHVLTDIKLSEVLPFLNNQMLLGKHLGVKGVQKKMNNPHNKKILKLRRQIKDVITEGIADKILSPKVIYRWFKATTEGESIIIHPAVRSPHLTAPDNDQKVSFSFPRQQDKQRLSAVDWIRSEDQGGDYVGLFIATSGIDTAERSAEMREQGRLLDSHILQALAIEIAEATAEYVHRQMRADWGIPDSPELTLKDIFKTKYHGIRLSFGYPACPDLDDQQGLFNLLKPEDIGITLTDGMMMHPESSVSAVVFHHPDGKYYAV